LSIFVIDEISTRQGKFALTGEQPGAKPHGPRACAPAWSLPEVILLTGLPGRKPIFETFTQQGANPGPVCALRYAEWMTGHDGVVEVASDIDD